MTPQEIDRIQNAIRHIESSLDVDPWAMEIAVKAMEKQIPKKPIRTEFIYGCSVKYYCPECVEYMGTKGKHSVILFDKPKYCSCGQAIDWSDAE